MVDRYGEEVDTGTPPPASSTPRGPVAPPRWETVHAGTRPSICTGHQKKGGTCRAEVFWIRRPKIRGGKPVPSAPEVRLQVDCDVVGGERPTSVSDGRGHSHFLTCVDAKRF